MKRLIALALALLLIAALAAPVLADETVVTYTKTSAYLISIPASVDLSDGPQKIMITATEMNLAPKRLLKVSVVSGITDGKVILKDKADETVTAESVVSFTEGGEGIADRQIVAVFEGTGLEPVENGTLYFSALPDDQQAGDYAGVITFSMAVEDVSSPIP